MEFEKVLLKNILEINPKTVLKKGTLAKKVAMENIKENLKHIKNYSLETFKSGAKFKNGDTLVARITPCLENGKTAYVDILEDDEVAFGSTEFFVIRPKQHKADSQFLYYLMRTPYIREILIKSMTGTSGRQRAQKDSLLDLQIDLPKYECQVVIGKLLSNLDDKIRLNSQLTANLEELSQVLFKRWFVDFEFPDENGNPYKSNGGKFKESAIGDIPSDWEASVFNNFIEENIAGDWGKATSQKNYNSKVTIIRGADIPQLKKGEPGAPPSRYILEKNKDKKQIQNGDIVIEVSGGSPTQSTGRTLYVNQNILERFRTPVLSTNFCRILRPKSIEYGQWLELYFQYLYEKDVFFNFENGTTGIKNFDYKAILTKFNIISPTNDIIRKFHYEISYLRDHIQNLGSENQKLSELRDTLLPKLMSGEIELPDTLEVTEDAELLQRR